MPQFLARRKKTKSKRLVTFMTKYGLVSFRARRKPKRRYRVKF
jgi:recombinational DNA repair protein (RecF pathway)